MKIKTTKKLNLPELIQYVWENPTFEKRVFFGSDDQRVVFDSAGGFYPSGYCYDIKSLFTFEVEEELTEETEFKQIIALYQDCGIPRSFGMSGVSIREIKTSLEIRYIEPLKIFIYTDELIEIWSRGSGIPESGVLEVEMRIWN